jgi:hypothetical protein
MSCYKAAGRIYFRNKELANQPYLFVGNAQAELNTTETETSVPDYTSVAGGNACVDKIIDKVTLGLTFYDFQAANLARAVAGALSTGAVTPVTDEIVNAFIGELCPTAQLINVATPPVVSSAAGIGGTAYTVNVDYTYTKDGIRVVPGGPLATAIAAGSGTPKSVQVFIDYTPLARDVIQALTKSGSQVECLILTENRANAGKFGRWQFWTVQLSAAAAIAIITRDFSNLALTGEVLPDATKNVGGNSAYFVIQNES